MLWCYHSDETFLAERLNGTIYSIRYFKWLFLAPFPGLYDSLFPRTPGKFECPLSDFESLAIKKLKVVTLANQNEADNQMNQPEFETNTCSRWKAWENVFDWLVDKVAQIF